MSDKSSHYCILFIRLALVLVTPTKVIKDSLTTPVGHSAAIIVSGVCTFPDDWHGNWHESRDGDVTISSTHFTSKGSCVSSDHRQLYLVENNNIGCHTCLRIQLRHFNVLQVTSDVTPVCVSNCVISTCSSTRKRLSVTLQRFNSILLRTKEFRGGGSVQVTTPTNTCFNFYALGKVSNLFVGFCVGRDSLQRICSTIQNETMRQTLIRDAGKPSLCPFRDAYHFAYSNNSGGFCRNPMSYVKPCAPSGQLRFHFRHCSDAAYTYQQDIDVECIASWNEDGASYLIGRLMSRDKASKHDRFRCLMYRVLGTAMQAVMSGDASCRGLLSPRDGPVVMEFTQDVFGWPRSLCLYPSWVVRTAWRDLNGQHVYRSFYDDSPDGAAAAAIIHVSYRQSVEDSRLETAKVLRCHTILSKNTTATQLTAVSFITHGCLTKYQCIKFIRHDGAVEVHEGRYTEHSYEPCMETDMLESNRRFLIPEVLTSRSCPMRGQYAMRSTGSSDVCPSYFRIGCNRTDVIEVTRTCSETQDLRLECLKSWKYDTARYLIARLVDDQGGKGVDMTRYLIARLVDDQGGKGVDMTRYLIARLVDDHGGKGVDMTRYLIARLVDDQGGKGVDMTRYLIARLVDDHGGKGVDMTRYLIARLVDDHGGKGVDMTRYLIARLVDDHGGKGVANCFSFQRRGSVIQFTIDNKCNAGAVTDHAIGFTLERKAFECDQSPVATAVHLLEADQSPRKLLTSSNIRVSSTSHRNGAPYKVVGFNDHDVTRRKQSREHRTSSSLSIFNVASQRYDVTVAIWRLVFYLISNV